MPQGELFIRSKRTRQLSSGATGLITTRPASWPSAGTNQGDGWIDAHVRYGLSLEAGARSKLLTPARMKTPTNATNAESDGVAFYGGTIGKYDKNEFSFDVHIVASTQEQFLQRYQLFCDEILRDQYFQLRLGVKPDKVRHLLFDDCEPFSEFRLKMAKFTLAVIEPHPEITDEREPSIM